MGALESPRAARRGLGRGRAARAHGQRCAAAGGEAKVTRCGVVVVVVVGTYVLPGGVRAAGPHRRVDPHVVDVD